MLDSAEQRPTLCESEVPKMLSEVNDPFDTLGKSECDRLSPDRGVSKVCADLKWPCEEMPDCKAYVTAVPSSMRASSSPTTDVSELSTNISAGSSRAFQGRFCGRLATKEDEELLVVECSKLGKLLGASTTSGSRDTRDTLPTIVRAIASGTIRAFLEHRDVQFQAMSCELSQLKACCEPIPQCIPAFKPLSPIACQLMEDGPLRHGSPFDGHFSAAPWDDFSNFSARSTTKRRSLRPQSMPLSDNHPWGGQQRDNNPHIQSLGCLPRAWSGREFDAGGALNMTSSAKYNNEEALGPSGSKCAFLPPTMEPTYAWQPQIQLPMGLPLELSGIHHHHSLPAMGAVSIGRGFDDSANYVWGQGDENRSDLSVVRPPLHYKAMGTKVRTFKDEDAHVRGFGVPLINPALRRGRPASSGDIPQLALQGNRMYDYMPTCMEGSGQDTGRFSWREDSRGGMHALQHGGSGVPASGGPAPESLIFGGMETALANPNRVYLQLPPSASEWACPNVIFRSSDQAKIQHSWTKDQHGKNIELYKEKSSSHGK